MKVLDQIYLMKWIHKLNCEFFIFIFRDASATKINVYTGKFLTLTIGGNIRSAGLGPNTYSYLYLYSNTQIFVFVFVFVFEKYQIGVFVFVFVFEQCIWTYLKNIFQIQLQF